MAVELEIHTSINDINPAEWERCFGRDYPFLRYDFLAGLERTACTTEAAGWQPCHLLLRDQEICIAAAPGFLKSHSYGEYVFDWAWADAWQRNGLNYYPKLITAAPFTPSSGPRLFIDADYPQAQQVFLSAVANFCEQQNISGWHLLFTPEDLADSLDPSLWCRRTTTQFHWFNKDYRCFDDFLARFNSRKRKNLRRERQRIAEQGLSLTTRVGSDISAEHWQFFHRCYQMTYAKRSGHGGYLTREFFTDVCPAMGDAAVMVIAEQASRPVAAALYFQSADTLYGRYWGCLEEFENLHFEACYYQGIEYCIANNKQRFDPGAQGEHKIQRGFEPVLTHSAHWVAEPDFRAAIASFCDREREQVDRYRKDASTYLPFKNQD